MGQGVGHSRLHCRQDGAEEAAEAGEHGQDEVRVVDEDEGSGGDHGDSAEEEHLNVPLQIADEPLQPVARKKPPGDHHERPCDGEHEARGEAEEAENHGGPEEDQGEAQGEREGKVAGKSPLHEQRTNHHAKRAEAGGPGDRPVAVLEGHEEKAERRHYDSEDNEPGGDMAGSAVTREPDEEKGRQVEGKRQQGPSRDPPAGQSLFGGSAEVVAS